MIVRFNEKFDTYVTIFSNDGAVAVVKARSRDHELYLKKQAEILQERYQKQRADLEKLKALEISQNLKAPSGGIISYFKIVSTACYEHPILTVVVLTGVVVGGVGIC